MQRYLTGCSDGTGQAHFLRAGDGDAVVFIAGFDRNRRRADHVKPCPGGYRSAGIDIDVGAGGHADGGVGITRSHHRPFQYDKAGVGCYDNRRTGTFRLQRCRDDDGCGGINRDGAMAVQRIDRAPHIGGDAVRFGAVTDDDVGSGTAVYNDRYFVVPYNPAGHHNLFSEVEIYLPCGYAGIGRPKLVVIIGFPDLREPGVERNGFTRLYITDDVDPVSLDHGIVRQLGVELRQFQSHLAVFDITDVHDYAVVILVADGDQREAVRQSVKIAHGKIHVAGVGTGGIVHTVLVAAGGTEEVILGGRHGFDDQFSGGGHFVASGRKIYIISLYGYISAGLFAFYDAGSKIQQRLGRCKLNVYIPLGGVETAIGTTGDADTQTVFICRADNNITGADDGQVIGFPDNDISRGAGAVVDNGQLCHVAGDGAGQAVGNQRQVRIGKVECCTGNVYDAA